MACRRSAERAVRRAARLRRQAVHSCGEDGAPPTEGGGWEVRCGGGGGDGEIRGGRAVRSHRRGATRVRGADCGGGGAGVSRGRRAAIGGAEVEKPIEGAAL